MKNLLWIGLLLAMAFGCGGDGQRNPLQRITRTSMPLDSLPPAVEKAFRDQYPQARILGMKLDPEDGQPFYQIECLQNGREMELLYTPEGELVEYEEEIPLREAPPLVAESINRKFPENKLKEVARVVRNQQVVGYKAKVKVGDMKFKIELDARGKIIHTRVK